MIHLNKKKIFLNNLNKYKIKIKMAQSKKKTKYIHSRENW